MKKALIIVDVQNDFCEGGALGVTGGNAVARRISEYVAANLDEYNGGIFTTQDWHVDPGDHWSENPDFVDSWPVHCEAGTKGAELHPAIESLSAAITSRHFKGMYSAAYSGMESIIPIQLWSALEVDIVGIATDYCVSATAVDVAGLAPRDRKVTVLTDLCAAIRPEAIAEQAKVHARRFGIQYRESGFSG